MNINWFEEIEQKMFHYAFDRIIVIIEIIPRHLSLIIHFRIKKNVISLRRKTQKSE